MPWSQGRAYPKKERITWRAGYKAYYYNTWLPSAFNDGIMAESEGGAGGVEEVQVKIVPEAMAIYEDPLDWR